MREIAHFLWQFARSPRAVGAVAPSSRHLAQAMIEWIDWSAVQTVAEFGPGTGAFTELVLQRKKQDAEYFGVEINPHFVWELRERFPQARFFEDSVANIASLCDSAGAEQLDAVICGLPWAAFSAGQQQAYMDALLRVLSPSGYFATFAYVQGLLLPAGQRFRRLLNSSFGSVSTSPTVWRNAPPAFVYQCQR